MTRNRILPIQGTTPTPAPTVATYIGEVTPLMDERAKMKRRVNFFLIQFPVVAALLLAANIVAFAALPFWWATLAIVFNTAAALVTQVVRLNAIQAIKNLNHAIRGD